MKYAEYVASKEWNSRRMKILDRDKKCVRCGAHYHLHVHHMTYENLGNEKFMDLVTICDPCHKIYHLLNHRASIETTEKFVLEGNSGYEPDVRDVFIVCQKKKKAMTPSEFKKKQIRKYKKYERRKKGF